MNRRRTVAIASAVVLALLAVIVSRAVWQGKTALARGDAASADDRLDEAISHWHRAARWYVPLAPHVEGAYKRLEDAAKAAESAGDQATALVAWRSIRSAVLATRSFFTPKKQQLELANQRIAALMAALEGPEADRTRTEEQRATWHLDLLEARVGPSIGYTLVALLGFVLWLGAAFSFAWLGLDEEERLRKHIALRCLVVFFGGVLMWLVGLARA